MKKKLVATLLTAAMVCSMGAVSAVSVAAEEADTLTIGFSQVGACLLYTSKEYIKVIF